MEARQKVPNFPQYYFSSKNIYVLQNYQFKWFFQGLATSFFLAPSGQRFTNISLAQNFAATVQKKEKLAKAILKDQGILEDKSLDSKVIVEDKSLSRHQMSTRTGKRKGEDNLEPEAKKAKLEEPAPLQLSKEVILRR